MIVGRMGFIVLSSPKMGVLRSSLSLKFGDSPLEPQCFQHSGRCLGRGHDLVTGAAVLRDALPVGRGMSFIVTSEATRKVRVAQVVFVCAPRNLEIRKYIFVVNGEDCLGCYVHVRGPGLNECGLRLGIKLPDCSRDL